MMPVRGIPRARPGEARVVLPGGVRYAARMFHTISEFQEAWKQESENTLKLFRNLTDASLMQPVVAGGRSLGFIAWHIVTSLPEMMREAKLPMQGPDTKAPVPDSAQAIAAAYEEAAASVAQVVRDNWTDEQLPGKIPMYGMEWGRAATLAIIIAHECHHRGQMTVLMRQAGLAVPGLYGPSQEEWAAYGMEAQK